MAEVTGYTAVRMKQIEDTTVVDGDIIGNDLVLLTRAGTPINAGNVRGPQGIQGIPGTDGANGATSIAVVTSTTRPTGPARFVGLEIYETETGRKYVWDGTQWVLRNFPIVCTSITRPASPYEGLIIYETDTDKILTYDGANWTLPKNIHGGELGYAPINAIPAAITTTLADVAGLSVSIMALANRKLEITVLLPYVTTTVANNAMSCLIREGAVTLGEALVIGHFITNPDSGIQFSCRITPTPGPHTYKFSAVLVTGSGSMSIGATATRTAFIKVEDIGGV